MSIDSLKIMRFRGLFDTPILRFNTINIIASPGNFGKTTLLQAIYLGCDIEDEARILNLKTPLKELLYFDGKNYVYDIAVSVNKTYIRKYLAGKFEGEKFTGGYTREAKIPSSKIENRFYTDVCFDKDTLPYKNNETEFAYFDFETTKIKADTSISDNMRYILEEYVRRFEDGAGKIFIKDETFMMNHKKLGEIPLGMLGSHILKMTEFVCFASKFEKKILLLDNADSGVSKDAWEYYAKFLISIVAVSESQVFITVRNREFYDVLLTKMKGLKFLHKANYINIFRNNSKIEVSCTVNEEEKFDSILGI